MYLGAHIGTSDGLAEAARTGRSIGCDVIQIFSKSPHMWKAPPILPENAAAFRAAVGAAELQAVAIHHNYLTNLASPKNPVYFGSRTAFLEEIRRAESLGATQLIFHPGAHSGSGPLEGIRRIAEALTWAVGEAPEAKVRILLENAAGQGTTIGGRFEELADVLDRVGEPKRFGIAIDTCHLFASGRDFRTPEGYGAVVDDLRATVGTAAVQAFHLNDSKGACGQHLDRHENIGKGQIGTEGFRPWLNDPTWEKVPGYLETPLGEDDEYLAYVADLRVLRGLIGPTAAGTKPRAPARRGAVRKR
jgi:deoxyribonuclease-4